MARSAAVKLVPCAEGDPLSASLLRSVLADAGCARMWKWPLAQDLSVAWRWRHFFFCGSCDRIARNFTKRYFAQRYSRAPFIHINRRSSRARSLIQLNYDEIIRALDIFATPDFAALRTSAIQIDGACVRFGVAGTSDLHDTTSGRFPIYGIGNHILKVPLAVAGYRPNPLIFRGDNFVSHR